MMANRVVLPAPFGPISAVMRPACAASDARSTASRPPKRFDTCSPRSRGSAMTLLRGCQRARLQAPPQIGNHPGNAARCEGDDHNEYAAIDHKVESWRRAGHELGELAEGFDHQRAEQRTEHGADAAD